MIARILMQYEYRLWLLFPGKIPLDLILINQTSQVFIYHTVYRPTPFILSFDLYS